MGIHYGQGDRKSLKFCVGTAQPYNTSHVLLFPRAQIWVFTETTLGVCLVDEATKEDLVGRRLWEKSNLESYLAEMRKESKRRR